MYVRKITKQQDVSPVAKKRGRPVGSKNTEIPEYRYRCKKCNHQFSINVRAFYHTCPKCHGQTDCITTKGVLKG